MLEKKWYLYILICSDDSLYTGITTDVQKRFNKHISGKGSKYVKSRLPAKIAMFYEVGNRSEASKEECRVKKLTKKEKELLINEKNCSI